MRRAAASLVPMASAISRCERSPAKRSPTAQRCLSGSARTLAPELGVPGHDALAAGGRVELGDRLRLAGARTVRVDGLARAIESSHERIAAGSRTVVVGAQRRQHRLLEDVLGALGAGLDCAEAQHGGPVLVDDALERRQMGGAHLGWTREPAIT